MTPRTVSQIKAQMIAAKNAESSLAGLNSTSQTAIWNLIYFIVAVAISLFEQIMAQFQTDIEAEIAAAPAGTDAWVQKKTFEFQYDATTPQLVVLNNYAPSYNPVDATKRIITRCSVKTSTVKICNIKVAKSDPPSALSGPELTALKGYWNNTGSNTATGRGIGFAGVNYNVVSYSPDLVIVSGNLKYDGQYTSTIKAAVIAAIKDYFANIDFDGNFVINKMIDYIQAVPGVIDFTPEDVAIRTATSSFPSGLFYVCQGFQVIYPSYSLFAGYCIGETTVNFNIGDNITFIAN